MKRLLCITALAAVVLVPDWASACWARWGRPIYRPYCAPAYRAPFYYAPPPPVYYQPVCPPPVFVQPCVPVQPPMMAPPQVQPVKPSSDHSRAAPAPSPSVARPQPAPPSVQPEPVRPAGDLAPAKPAEPVKPQPAPVRGPVQSKEPKVGPVELSPNPAPALLPAPDKPKPEELKFPAVEAPKEGAGVKAPAIELPKDSKLPPLEVPGASAVPVPAPSADVLIPPAGVPGPKADSLPPLALPPDTPVAPNAVEAKSSPIGTATTALKVSVFPATGTAAAGQFRKVGFYNHTARDLSLTIEGRAVTLPAKSYLFAQLPTAFSWQCAGRAAAKETVPADAAGLDVLIRE